MGEHGLVDHGRDYVNKAEEMQAEVDRRRVTEEELKAKAVAPRVSQEDLEAAIEGEWYLTGRQAIMAAGMNPPEDMDRLTICLIRMVNGFVILGHSAPASAENFDPAIGRRLARERAIMQIWQLMGFLLRERLHAREMAWDPARNPDEID